MSETFKRVIEDFECLNCGTHVTGNGYTNHCPQCLYSQHVDINPGDRAARCGGLMEPISIAPKGNYYVLTHRCVTCGFEHNTRTSDGDNIEDFLESLGDPDSLAKRLPPT